MLELGPMTRRFYIALLTILALAACKGEEPASVISAPTNNEPIQGVSEPDPGPIAAATGEDAGQNDAIQTVAQPRIATSPTRRRAPTPPDIDHLLSRVEIRELTQFTGSLQRSELEGQEPSEVYNAMRFAGENHLGVAVQLWSLNSSARTTQRFDRLRETFVEPVGARGIGDSAFRSDYPGMRQFVFVSRQHNVVVAIACDESVCTDEGHVTMLAERAESHL